VHVRPSSLFKFAHENGYADRNVVSTLSPLKKGKPQPDPLTRDEFTRLIDACQSRQLKNFWSLAVYSGMQHGELCALAWEDVDLVKGTITVRRNLTNQDDFTPPKTASDERTVFLVDSAVRVLKDQLELTRMRPPAAITMFSREYGKNSKEELTFVFNPKVTAVNKASDDYYTVASIPKHGVLPSDAPVSLIANHINQGTLTHAGHCRQAQTRTTSPRKWVTRMRRWCIGFMAPGCQRTIRISFPSSTRK